jgi:hypothetical protein
VREGSVSWKRIRTNLVELRVELSFEHCILPQSIPFSFEGVFERGLELGLFVDELLVSLTVVLDSRLEWK